MPTLQLHVGARLEPKLIRELSGHIAAIG